MTYYQVSAPELALTIFQRAAALLLGSVLAALMVESFPPAVGEKLVNGKMISDIKSYSEQ
jgi:hypothetical protein